MKTRQSIYYIDRFSLSSILFLMFAGRHAVQIYYFDHSPMALKIMVILVKCRVLTVMPRKLDFMLAQVQNDNGGARFLDIWKDVRKLSGQVSDQIFDSSVFLSSLKSHWDLTGMKIYFRKMFADSVFSTVVFIHVCQWHAAKEHNQLSGEAIYLSKFSFWSGSLSCFARDKGVQTSFYVQWSPGFVFTVLKKVRKFRKKSSVTANTSTTSTSVPLLKRPIGVCFAGRMLSVDCSLRSDVFWLSQLNDLRSKTMVYLQRKNITPPDTEINSLVRAGISVVVMAPKPQPSLDLARWQPGQTYHTLMKKGVCAVALAWFKALLHGQVTQVFYLINMAWYVHAYAYWYDFFVTSGIKLNVNPDYSNPFHVPMNEALRHAGGISIAYQWSHLYFSLEAHSMDTDVLYSFSPHYWPMWRENRSRIGSLVSNGFVTDYAFAHVRTRAQEARLKLKSNGAEFILCYLDENSSNDRLSVIPGQRAEFIYRQMLRLVHEDKTLGLVLKPAYVHDLYERHPDLKPLLQEAVATGRCLLVDEGNYKTNMLPCEAAQMADLTVGILLGGSAILECVLSGSKAVFLDLERIYSHDLYARGKGTVVFDSWEGLEAAIRCYRKDPLAHAGFADLSSWAANKDLFHDGKAAVRMAEHMTWLLDKIEQGHDRADALSYAAEQYAQKYGKDKISNAF